MDKNDVIQITDENHKWYPAILIVTEVKSWGVQAGMFVPPDKETYIRLDNGTFEKIGSAIVGYV